jgi:hypothetical protein
MKSPQVPLVHRLISGKPVSIKLQILPKGGFGNLTASPSQKQARQRENSVFIDEHFNDGGARAL